MYIPFNNGPRDKIQKYLSFPDVTEYKDIKSLLDFQGFNNGLASLLLLLVLVDRSGAGERCRPTVYRNRPNVRARPILLQISMPFIV